MSLSIQEIRKRLDALEQGGAIELEWNAQWYKIIDGALRTCSSERDLSELDCIPSNKWQLSTKDIQWVIYRSDSDDTIWLPKTPPSQVITHVRKVEL